MPTFELAQLNIAHMRTPIDAPEMADFVANLDRINALAEAAPGFVWRLQSEDGNATALRPFGDSTLVNLSVWADVEALNAYVYKSLHVEIMKRRKEWFDRMEDAYMVLWWVPAGHRPAEAEAMERLQMLRAKGPTQNAFTFKTNFPAPV
jgi:Domain of unknown function (DUF3291)